jgi:hypothetical protein
VTARTGEPKPAARVWAALAGRADPVALSDFEILLFFIYFTVLNAICDFHI